MSAAIAPNPNDPQAPLGMPARPWWIGYIRQLHLDIPLAVESGGTGKNTPLDASDIAETAALKILTADERTKLAGIAEGAEVNTVDSVAGRTGAVTLDADDVAPTSSKLWMSDTQSTKLAGIAENANNYTHPATHPQSMIEGLADALSGKQDASNAVTTDTNQAVTGVKTFRATNLYYGPAEGTNHFPLEIGCGSTPFWRFSQYAGGNLVIQCKPTNSSTWQAAMAFIFQSGGTIPWVQIYNNAAGVTHAAADNSTKLATTAFVQAQKVDTALTGTPTAPTATAGTNTTQIASTEFVQTAVAPTFKQFSTVTQTSTNVTTAAVDTLYVNTLTGGGTTPGAGTLTVALPSPTGNAGKLIGLSCSTGLYDAYDDYNSEPNWSVSGHIDGISSNTQYTAAGTRLHGVVFWCDGSSWWRISQMVAMNSHVY